MNLLIFAFFLSFHLFTESKYLDEFNNSISIKNGKNLYRFESQIRFKRQINPKNGNGASKRMGQIRQELARKGNLGQEQIRYNRIVLDEDGQEQHVSGLIVNLKNPSNPRRQSPAKQVHFDERWNEYYSVPAKRRVTFDQGASTVHQLPPPPQVSFARVPTVVAIPGRPRVSFNPEPAQIIPVPSRNQQLQMEIRRTQPALVNQAMRIGRNVLHHMDRGIQRLHRAFGGPAWPRRYAERNRQRRERNRLEERGRRRK